MSKFFLFLPQAVILALTFIFSVVILVRLAQDDLLTILSCYLIPVSIFLILNLFLALFDLAGNDGKFKYFKDLINALKKEDEKC